MKAGDLLSEIEAASKTGYAADARVESLARRAAACGMRIHAETERMVETMAAYDPDGMPRDGAKRLVLVLFGEPRLKNGRRVVARGWPETMAAVEAAEMKSDPEVKTGTGGNTGKLGKTTV